MTRKDGPRYSEAAEVVTVTGWACKACHRWHGSLGNELAEHMARYCCSTTAICKTCGVEHDEKGYTVCKACRDKADEARWQERLKKAVPWDGKSPICSDLRDRWFFDMEELAEFLHEERDDFEGLRLCVGKPNCPREFNIEEFLEDDLPDDYDSGDLAGADELNKIVNEWIEARSPISWDVGLPVLLSTLPLPEQPTVE